MKYSYTLLTGTYIKDAIDYNAESTKMNSEVKI